MVEKKICIKRAFESTGLSLPIDGSADESLIHFQGQPRGLPAGMTFARPS